MGHEEPEQDGGAGHPRLASRPRSRRDAQESAGGGFRGSIQALWPRGSRDQRGEALVRILSPDPVSAQEAGTTTVGVLQTEEVSAAFTGSASASPNTPLFHF